MLDVPYLPPAIPGGDRSGRLIAAGVILLLVGLLCGCATAMMPFSYFMTERMARQMPTAPPLPPNAGPAARRAFASYRPLPHAQVAPLVVGAVMYLSLAVAATWLGIAALRKRRYVRPLVLIFGTHGIIFGVMTIAMFALFLPLIVEQMRRTAPQAPLPLAYVGFAISGIFMAVFLIGLPVTLIVLMKPDGVRLTAEYFDERRRWTDGLPIKLLGCVVTLAVLAVFELAALSQPGLPMVHTILRGPPFVLVILLHAALIAASAVLVYRRRMLGWNLAMIGLVLPCVVYGLSSILLPSEVYLSLLNHQPETLDLVRDHETLFRATWAVTTIIFLIATVIYLLRLRPLVEAPVAGLASE